MPLPKQDKQINRSFIREKVYDAILGWIMEGVLRPGEKMSDASLAEHLGVSRTPVREALRRLEDKGLVETAANRWTRVAPISLEEAGMIYPILWSLENLALEEAINGLTETDLAAMKEANARLEQALAADDPVAASQADVDFHNVIFARSGNPHLISLVEDLKIRHRRLEVHYFQGSGHALESVTEHTRLIEALSARNVDRARELVKRNWLSSLARMRDAAAREQQPSGTEV